MKAMPPVILLLLASAVASAAASDPRYARAASALEALQYGPCGWDGYNFTSMSGADLPGSDASYTYSLHLCNVVSNSAPCSTAGGFFCQYSKSTPRVYVHMISKWDNTGTWSTCTDATNCPNGGVQVAYANGDPCGGSGGAPRAVTVQFACKPGSSQMTYQVLPGANACSYYVVFSNELGCAPAPPTPSVCMGGPHNEYNLTALSGITLYGNDGSFNYELSLCSESGDSTCAHAATGSGGSFCQYSETTPPRMLNVLTRWDNSGQYAPCTLEGICVNGGVIVTFRNGDICSTGPIETQFVFVCEPGAFTPAEALAISSMGPCAYQFLIATPESCTTNSSAEVIGAAHEQALHEVARRAIVKLLP